ncbi:4-coumarate--CoA ligase 1-like [Magnolia sinica]|uniref:4-coumarate--CoA ligase 1-like n=1 Tax=Magnolia sinica TaxID=86752 RepID=UPI002658376A|nr:4-coumarate--CoA ligase 1-like [Magnolia sinica]
MILLENSPEFVFSFMGVSIIGLVTTATKPFYTVAKIYKKFSSFATKLVSTQSQYVIKLRDVVSIPGSSVSDMVVQCNESTALRPALSRSGIDVPALGFAFLREIPRVLTSLNADLNQFGPFSDEFPLSALEPALTLSEFCF